VVLAVTRELEQTHARTGPDHGDLVGHDRGAVRRCRRSHLIAQPGSTSTTARRGMWPSRSPDAVSRSAGRSN
jgi:hypothetical protein